MNGFVVKPIDPDELWRALAALIRPRDGLGHRPPPVAGAWSAAAALPTASVQALLLNIAGLDTRLGLRRVMGQQSRYLSMLRKFMVSQADVFQDLTHALDDGDAQHAERIAHTLKGLAGNIGALSLEAAAATLEETIKLGYSRDAINRQIDRPRGLLADLLAALRAKLQADPSGAPLKAASPAQVQAACSRLGQLLADDDAEAEDVFTQNAEMLREALGSDFTELKSAIDAFSFDKALIALNKACDARSIIL